jgi:integrase
MTGKYIRWCERCRVPVTVRAVSWMGKLAQWEGKPVRSFRRAWLSACTAAGLPHRIVHDFRRTSARNLSRAGVPEGVIMGLCGWKTRSVFDRYRIVNADLADGLAELAVANSASTPEPSKVVRLATGTERVQNGRV